MPQKLFLLDAMALIYRAHFAFSKSPRITSAGVNTSAVFGFTTTLLELLRKEEPTHLGIAFESRTPTFRHQEYAPYKAQREQQPEDVSAAIPLVQRLAESFRIPVLFADGYEADDVIGTLATQAAAKGFDVYMMTPDKDFGQLVKENVFLYKPSYMGRGVEVWGIAEVLDKWKIDRVEQVIDMLGLQGDASDNIPGVPGVGPKTAAKLIAEYGSVEHLVANASRIKGKLGEKIVAHAEQALLSKHLATICVDVPVPFDPDALRYDGPDEEKLRALFEELEFRTLTRRVFNEPAPTTVGTQGELFVTSPVGTTADAAPEALGTIDTVAHDYHLMDTPEKQASLRRFLARQTAFCFDTETDGIDPTAAELVGLAFAWHPREAYYVPLPPDRAAAETVLAPFRDLFADEQVTKVGQNLKFDITMLKRYGLTVRGPLFDTMLAHYLIAPGQRHGLDYLSETYLGYRPVPIESLIGKKGKGQKTMRDVPLDQIKEYAAEDADLTWQLRDHLAPQLEKYALAELLRDVEGPLVQVLSNMELAGVRVDTDALGELSGTLATDADAVAKRIFAVAGQEFNIGSPKQLGEILFDKLKLVDSPRKTRTGQYATGEDILSQLANEHAIAADILTYRELQKLKSTYVDALPALIHPGDGRIHTSFNQAVTTTGRLSSTNPNLQNIPIRTERGREIRKAFVPRDAKHVIFAADYSQVELRIMASFSGDPGMKEAFQQGLDIHTSTASRVFKVSLDEVTPTMRRQAKTVNFGIIYGVSAFGLAQRIGISRQEASEVIKAYFAEFDSVKAYMDASIDKARQQGYVTTLLGRRRYLPDINSQNQTLRGYSERNAINAPIQGSAADIIKMAMIRIHAWMRAERLRSTMILQVHDELVFDAHRDEVDLLRERIPTFMREALTLDVPLEVEVGSGENWLEAH